MDMEQDHNKEDMIINNKELEASKILAKAQVTEIEIEQKNLNMNQKFY